MASRSRKSNDRPDDGDADHDDADHGDAADAADDASHLERLYRAMHAVIRRIPGGRVATYGQVAELAGLPGGARIAAAALKTSSSSDALPWQRVIGKASKLRGRIAIHDPIGAAVQRQLLEQEGVEVGDSGLIALDRFGWLPSERATTARTSTTRTARTSTTASKRGTSSRNARAGSDRAASPRRPPRSASKRRASSSRR